MGIKWLVDLLKQLGDLKAYASAFARLCTEHPWLAVLVVTPLVLILASTAWAQSKRLLRRANVLTRTVKGRLMVGLMLLASAVVSTAIVLTTQRLTLSKPFVLAPVAVIGRNWTLQWSLEPAQDNSDYQVEEAPSPDFTSNVTTSYTAARQPYKYILQSFNRDTYWRVRGGKRRSKTSFDPTSAWSEPAKVSQFDTVLDRVVSTQTVRVYMSNSFNQSFYRFEKKDGQLAGFDAELASRLITELSSKLGVSLRANYTPVPWAELLQAPGKTLTADLIISSITKTKDREVEYAITFSDAYETTGYSLIFRPRDEALFQSQSVGELVKARSIGVQDKTTSVEIVNLLTHNLSAASAATVRPYPEIWNAIDDLLSGARPLDFLITDTPFAESAQLLMEVGGTQQLAIRPIKDGEVPPEIPSSMLIQEYAIAIRNGESKLSSMINSELQSLKDSGELKRLQDKARAEYREFTLGKP